MTSEIGGEVSPTEFEAALALAVAGEIFTDIGGDDVDVAIRAVASSAPGSAERSEAIAAARRAFDRLDQEVDDEVGWSGPTCPSCGAEMNLEVVRTRNGLKGRCPSAT